MRWKLRSSGREILALAHDVSKYGTVSPKAREMYTLPGWTGTKGSAAKSVPGPDTRNSAHCFGMTHSYLALLNNYVVY